MIPFIVSILFVVVGLINFAPVIGLFSAEKLHQLYDLDISDPNLLVLMRHRALLFGLSGGLIIYAAFRPELQNIAAVIGLVSMFGFVILAWKTDGLSNPLQRVMRIDIFGIVLLIIGASLG